VLSKPETKTLKEIFAILDAAGVPDDFMSDRDTRPAGDMNTYHTSLIEQGLRDAYAGSLTSHEDVGRRMRPLNQNDNNTLANEDAMLYVFIVSY
jgi:hypothetical protein